MAHVFGTSAVHKKKRRMPTSLGGSAADVGHALQSKRPCVPTKRLRFAGDIVVLRTAGECEAQARHLMRAFDLPPVSIAGAPDGGADAEAAVHDAIGAGDTSTYDVALGFDVEWKVTYKAGQAPHPVAMLQLACNRRALGGSDPRPGGAGRQQRAATAAAASMDAVDREHVCFLFHVWHGGVPPSLAALLEHPRVLLCGVSTMNDARKLAKDVLDGSLPACRPECRCRTHADANAKDCGHSVGSTQPVLLTEANLARHTALHVELQGQQQQQQQQPQPQPQPRWRRSRSMTPDDPVSAALHYAQFHPHCATAPTLALRGLLELGMGQGCMAARRVRGILSLNQSSSVSLATLCEQLLGRTLGKQQGTRTGNWEFWDLDASQTRYAATDAVAGLLVFEKLRGLPLLQLPRALRPTAAHVVTQAAVQVQLQPLSSRQTSEVKHALAALHTAILVEADARRNTLGAAPRCHVATDAASRLLRERGAVARLQPAKVDAFRKLFSPVPVVPSQPPPPPLPTCASIAAEKNIAPRTVLSYALEALAHPSMAQQPVDFSRLGLPPVLERAAQLSAVDVMRAGKPPTQAVLKTLAQHPMMVAAMLGVQGPNQVHDAFTAVKIVLAQHARAHGAIAAATAAAAAPARDAALVAAQQSALLSKVAESEKATAAAMTRALGPTSMRVLSSHMQAQIAQDLALLDSLSAPVVAATVGTPKTGAVSVMAAAEASSDSDTKGETCGDTEDLTSGEDNQSVAIAKLPPHRVGVAPQRAAAADAAAVALLGNLVSKNMLNYASAGADISALSDARLLDMTSWILSSY